MTSDYKTARTGEITSTRPSAHTHSGYGHVKHDRPPSWLKLGDGSEWTASVAVVRGLLIRDGEQEGNIFVEGRSLPAASWIEQGVIDQECADYVLGLPQCRNPQAPVETISHRRAPTFRPTLPQEAPEVQFVAAMRRYIESEMTPEDDEKLAIAFRKAARASCGISGR